MRRSFQKHERRHPLDAPQEVDLVAAELSAPSILLRRRYARAPGRAPGRRDSWLRTRKPKYEIRSDLYFLERAQSVPQPAHHEVDDDHVAVLRDLHIEDGAMDTQIHCCFQLPTVESGQATCEEAVL